MISWDYKISRLGTWLSGEREEEDKRKECHMSIVACMMSCTCQGWLCLAWR